MSNSTKRPATLIIMLAWLLPALACNLPGPPDVVVESTQALELVETLPAATASDIPQPEPSQVFAETETREPPVEPFSRLVGDQFYYFTRSGDTRRALELRFAVDTDQIAGLSEYPPQAMLPIGLEVHFQNILDLAETDPLLLPDSEVVYSHTAVNFSTAEYVRASGGFLSTYFEDIDGQSHSGAQIVERVAIETSIHPRLLLAFLQYRSGWVRGSPTGRFPKEYPLGFFAGNYSGFYDELLLTARQLTIGYYGWRSGRVVELDLLGGEKQRIDPMLNPGSAALQYLFARLYGASDWRDELYQPERFMALYAAMFGDPWQRATEVLPDGVAQPVLELPFQPGETWTLTGGPHVAWGVGSAWGGIDFAPADVEPGCTVTRYWATALANGLVTRAEHGVVAIDLDGDGFEGSGWVVVYLHIAGAERVVAGTWVKTDDRIGHPSCEGGVATGTHVHVARKFNGEWIAADGPLPFVLSGWRAWEGYQPYSGSLTRGDQVVTARPDGTHTSLITR